MKGKEEATQTSSPQCVFFKASLLSVRLGWSALAFVTHSGIGQENLTEVLLYLCMEKNSVMWALLPQTLSLGRRILNVNTACKSLGPSFPSFS